VLSLVERKKILQSIIARKSSWVGYVSFIDRKAELFELVKRNDLEGLVAKRKDGLYKPDSTKWFKVMNSGYSQKAGRQEFFQKTSRALTICSFLLFRLKSYPCARLYV
jgi:ATP-dependent DNA ligase